MLSLLWILCPSCTKAISDIATIFPNKLRVCRSCGRPFLVSFANHLCHVVEGEALAAADGGALVVVLPGGEEKELAALAGFHALAAGLGEVGEAVLL